MKCPVCGFESTGNFCTSCGAPLAQATPAEPISSASTVPSPVTAVPVATPSPYVSAAPAETIPSASAVSSPVTAVPVATPSPYVSTAPSAANYSSDPALPAYGQQTAPNYNAAPPLPTYGQQTAAGYNAAGAPPAYGQQPPSYNPTAYSPYAQPSKKNRLLPIFIGIGTLALILIVALVVILWPKKEDTPAVVNPPSTGNNGGTIVTPPVAGDSTPIGTVLYEGNGIKITYTGLEENGSYSGHIIKFSIENSNPVEMEVQARNGMVNGVSNDFIMSVSVPSGQSVDDSLVIVEEELNGLSFGEMEVVTLNFHLFNWDGDDYDTDSETITIYL